MKNSSKFLLFIILSAFLFQSCEDRDDNPVPSSITVNDFVWKGLNTYYLWQAEVPNLADNRFADQNGLNNFLFTYAQPETLFQDLLNKPISQYPLGQAVDRFSVLFSDYAILEGVLSGNTLNSGVDYGLKRKTANPAEVFGWVRYILPNSDASNKAIYRGAIFYAVNGIPLYDNGNGDNNWDALLNDSSTFTLNLADYNNGNITPNGNSVTLIKTKLSENPVYLKTVINSGSHKIGYLVYNGFYSGYENQLNAAFAELKAQGITDFVLDLRYNSGGSVATATRLASMITGQFTGQVFAKQQWNAKAQAYFNSVNPSQLYNLFTNVLNNNAAINSLNLNTIYILTSKSTASASELVINGLKPYINVVQIGDLTTGKNVGSITVYDSPTFTKKNLNPNHRYAMQPLVFKTVNKSGFGEYTNGLVPTYELKEDLGNLGILGNSNEALLGTAIGKITNGGRMLKQNPTQTFEDVLDFKTSHFLKNQMYLETVPAGINSVLKQ